MPTLIDKVQKCINSNITYKRFNTAGIFNVIFLSAIVNMD